jgi:hypothetical protein
VTNGERESARNERELG